MSSSLQVLFRSYIHHNINTVILSSLPSINPSVATVTKSWYRNVNTPLSRSYSSNTSLSSWSGFPSTSQICCSEIPQQHHHRPALTLLSNSLGLSSSVPIRYLRTTVSSYQQTSSVPSSAATAASSSLSPKVSVSSPMNNDISLEEIILTPRAVQRIQYLQNKANNSISNNNNHGANTNTSSVPAKTLYLRVKVDGGGCSGFKYDFTIEYNDQPNTTEDRIFTRENSSVIIDNVSLDLLRGSVIDYEEGLLKASFVIASNPNAESSCGCKASFAVKEK